MIFSSFTCTLQNAWQMIDFQPKSLTFFTYVLVRSKIHGKWLIFSKKVIFFSSFTCTLQNAWQMIDFQQKSSKFYIFTCTQVLAVLSLPITHECAYLSITLLYVLT